MLAALNLYTVYRAHNLHFAIYGALFLGQYTVAIEAANEICSTIPENFLRVQSLPVADILESYLMMKQHVLVRFGKWQEVIDQELPSDKELYCVTTAMILYAKAVAHSALGQVVEAEEMSKEFLVARTAVPESRVLHNNPAIDLLNIAEEMLNGELEYRRENYAVAFDHLRKSVEFSDNLPYDEPWGWMQPPRHALGALLLEQNHFEEAEAVYRSDLGLDGKLNRSSIHPDNIWSLHGLHECLMQRGDTVEAPHIKQRLKLAQARSGVTVKTSCFCRANSV